MKRSFALILAPALLLLASGGLQAAVRGCTAGAEGYSPYGQWGDLPAAEDGLEDYVPITHWPEYTDPRVVSPRTDTTGITIILMHGKNGSPWFENQVALADELAALGYRVVTPTMPWGRKLYYTRDAGGTGWVRHVYFAWDADRCQALNYIERLVADERALGRQVVLMGHSMGAHHALLYGYLNTQDDIAGIIASAPGGLVPLATGVMNATAASRQRARDLVRAGAGDRIDRFETYNTGRMEEILTTAAAYRSYHEPDPDGIADAAFTPDVRDVLPGIQEPVLWLVGAEDALKGFYERHDLFGMLPGNAASRYRVLPGDHLSVLLAESGPIHDWLGAWPTAGPAVRRPVDGDFGGDGTADVLLRNRDTGQLQLWEMDGTRKTVSSIGALNPVWEIAGVADLGGDGKADILVRHGATGQLYLFEMDGNRRTGSTIGALSLVWDVVALDDFGGDGKADVLLRHGSTGQLYLLEMDGNRRTGRAIGALNPVWEVAGSGDLGGDGRADIVLRHGSTGQLYLWEMDGHRMTPSSIGPLNPLWEVTAVADFGGDGKDDLLLRHGETGLLYLFEMDANRRTGSTIGALSLVWEVVATDDFGGDGRADILLRHATSGQLSLWEMDGNARTARDLGALSPAWVVQ